MSCFVLESESAVLFLETPSNPRLRITDLRHAAVLAHAAGCLVVVDATMMYLDHPVYLSSYLICLALLFVCYIKLSCI